MGDVGVGIYCLHMSIVYTAGLAAAGCSQKFGKFQFRDFERSEFRFFILFILNIKSVPAHPITYPC
jgi:hypothetical protein